jgi:hypothetical protein
VGRTQMPKRGLLAAEADFLVVALGTEIDIGDVGEADDGAVALSDNEATEFLDARERGVGDEADANHGALGLPDGGKRVVGGQSLADLGGADAAGGELGGFQPDAHRKDAGAEHVGALHALDRGDLGLDEAVEVVGDLVLLEGV